MRVLRYFDCNQAWQKTEKHGILSTGKIGFLTKSGGSIFCPEIEKAAVDGMEKRESPFCQKTGEVRGNCNSLQDKELAVFLDGGPAKNAEFVGKTMGFAEIASFVFLIPCITRNYMIGFG